MKNIFRGTITVEREYDTNSPQSLMDAMTAFAAIKDAAESEFVVSVKSSTAKKKGAAEAAEE